MLTTGLVVGGAAWAAPTVTAVALTPASAATPSGEQPPPKPPEPPKEPPTDEPTPPPVDETPPPEQTPTPKPPSDEKPDETPPPKAPSDDTTAGGSELPDTGAGDATRVAALGGVLAAGGAALYAASRKAGDQPDGNDQQGATA